MLPIIPVIILILINTYGYLGKTSVFIIHLFYVFNCFLTEETTENGETAPVFLSVICLTAFLGPGMIFSGTEGKHPHETKSCAWSVIFLVLIEGICLWVRWIMNNPNSKCVNKKRDLLAHVAEKSRLELRRR